MTSTLVTRPWFAPGDRVRVDDRPAVGHCRTPWYLRGRTGEIVAVLGQFRDPERLAYHKPGLPALVLYKVRFSQKALWPGYAGGAADALEADLYESWLQPAVTKAASGRRPKASAQRKAKS